jgi:hypothetical protein
MRYMSACLKRSYKALAFLMILLQDRRGGIDVTGACVVSEHDNRGDDRNRDQRQNHGVLHQFSLFFLDQLDQPFPFAPPLHSSETTASEVAAILSSTFFALSKMADQHPTNNLRANVSRWADFIVVT